MSRRRAYYEDVRPSFVTPCPNMVGVTLVTPGYEDLAREAIRRFKCFSGLDTVALYAFEEPAFFRKLDIANLIESPRVVFYDADLWFVGDVDFQALDRSVFWGVREHGSSISSCFVHKDCLRFGIAPENYYNTGLMVFDLGNPLHKQVLKLARNLAVKSQQQKIPASFDRTEQTWINYALELLEVKRGFLPFSWNYFDFAVERFNAVKPEKIIGYHAAGVQLIDKLDHLMGKTSPIQWVKSSP